MWQDHRDQKHAYEKGDEANAPLCLSETLCNIMGMHLNRVHRNGGSLNRADAARRVGTTKWKLHKRSPFSTSMGAETEKPIDLIGSLFEQDR